ncbi:MAG: NAD(P)-dependent oxidoreductase [Betaproteobacteria bacterium]|nr:NAD(P)-dependent oxidoreductase [Betaproteobacteria bacterium]
MMTDTKNVQVGFVGLGIMGQSMAGHLLKAGHPLHLFNRTRSSAEALVARGAVWHETVGAMAAASDFVISMVGYPADVEAIYLGAGGIIGSARGGTVLIDMTTSSPDLAKKIAAAAQQRGLLALDAPVSGGDIGAREARLSIMVGGDQLAFEKALPLLQLMGGNVVLQGGPGAGQHTKMCNQIVIASTMLGVCEGLAYAQRSGLDPQTVLQSIGSGAASSFALNNLGLRILKNDFAPGFFIEHFVKDMGIALSEARRMNLDLPGLTLASQLYQQLVTLGYARNGTQALFKHYES